MTDAPGLNDIAVAWIEALTARGVSLTTRGKQLVMTPRTAYAEMSNDERRTLKLHKAAIVAIVEAGKYATATPKSATVEPAIPEAVCPFCMRVCVGREHPAFTTLHALDEHEFWRRRAEQREKERREWELRQRHGLPPPTWDLWR